LLERHDFWKQHSAAVFAKLHLNGVMRNVRRHAISIGFKNRNRRRLDRLATQIACSVVVTFHNILANLFSAYKCQQGIAVRYLGIEVDDALQMAEDTEA
jgi:hypothetical protein